MTNLKGKVVLITGAGKGSGKALAHAFAEQGATVAANDISPINVEDVVERINAQGGRAKAYIDDVAKKVAAQAVVNQVEDDFGGIDILIHHASVEPRSALLDMDEWDWHRTLDVNLTGTFLITQSVGRVMREKGRGVIVHLIAGEGSDVRGGRGAYLASMSGARALGQQAAQELAGYGIHVYTVERDTESVVETVLDLCRRQA